MNNNYEEFKEAVKSFSNWLDSIPPYEYSLSGVIIAYIIAPNLTNNAQNAFGSWLELVGQTILTITAKASATPETGQYNRLLADVENLKAEIERLKNRN